MSPNTSADDARAKQLAAELRCLVCQNQSIADSTAPLAIDLRNQINEQITAGKTDAEIKHYMAERYGDFVLYKPPFSAGNVALWVGPFVLLAVGLVAAIVHLRRRRRAPVTPPSAERIAALEQRYREEREAKP